MCFRFPWLQIDPAKMKDRSKVKGKRGQYLNNNDSRSSDSELTPVEETPKRKRWGLFRRKHRRKEEPGLVQVSPIEEEAPIPTLKRKEGRKNLRLANQIYAGAEEFSFPTPRRGAPPGSWE